MVTGIGRKSREPASYITFDDIIALALARTKSCQFFADSGKWQQALYEVRERYKDRIPQLEMMLFDESRSDIPPQSEELYQLINIMSAAKLISLPNPAFEHILMNKEQKERTIKLEEKLLQPYKEYIGNIAQILENKLAVKS
jgi:hypothetical protein